LDPRRKSWNDQQQELRKALSDPQNLDRAVRLFLDQHAMVHSREVSGLEASSFEDEIWYELDQAATRLIPKGFEHSIAWIFWHLTRIEDMTMGILVAGKDQLFFSEGWYERLGTLVKDTGNQMSYKQVQELSAQLDIPDLKAYRIQVGLHTRAIFSQLAKENLKEKVNPLHIEHLRQTGSVAVEAEGLLEYWGGLTIAGLLLMPPTRHTFIHINEALRIKQKVSIQ
jgi:hypothetical protein